MYKGDYDQEAIFLNKELDRKRIENEKCEAILYQADYEVLNSWNKDIRETRVVKFIHDNGTVYHGVYRGIDVDKNAPNSISNTLSTDEFFGSGDFWCAETDIPGDLEQTPCEIWLGNRDIDGNIDWNNSVYLNEKHLRYTGRHKITKSFARLIFGGGFFVLKLSGRGTAFLSSYGVIRLINLDNGEEVLIDNGHLVAWPDYMSYSIEQAASGLFSSITSGEGFVCRFRGPGTVLIQTRNPESFEEWIKGIAKMDRS